MKTLTCPICKKDFQTNHFAKVICGSYPCAMEHARRKAKEYASEKKRLKKLMAKYQTVKA